MCMQRASTKKGLSKESYPISFRLASVHLALLEKGAAQRETSIQKYARQLVLEALEDTERERLLYELAELKEALAKHREEFATATEALLDAIHDPKRAAPERVAEWVGDNLRT